MTDIQTLIILLYLFYFVVLFALILAQVTEIDRNYTNWGTAIVTCSHFCVGSIEVFMSSQSLKQKIWARYTYWYNVAADILTGGALVLSIVFLSMYWNNQTDVTAFVPVAIAIIGNVGCAYGRTVNRPRQPPEGYIDF